MNDWQDESIASLKRIELAVGGGIRALIVRGAAGTGKTTLVRSLIPVLENLRYAVVLLAPTGRAAKMLQIRTDHAAATIHSSIYNIGDSPLAAEDENGGLRWMFPLAVGRPARTAFIVDESSMVGEAEHHDGILQFGSGSLLKDIIGFSGIDCPEGDNLVIFVGDSYQLPPVGEKPTEPPALDERVLGGLIGQKICVVELTEVFRQGESSGILQEANRMRGAIAYHNFSCYSLCEHDDVLSLPEDDFDRLYHPERELDGKIVLAYTNAQVWNYNMRIRKLLGRATPLPQPGERLMSLRNTRIGTDGQEVQFMNGDLLDVIAADRGRVETLEGFYRPPGSAGETQPYTFTFCRMTVGWLYETGRRDVETWVNVTPLLSEAYRENPECASVALYVAVVMNIREKHGLGSGKADAEKLRDYLKRSAFYHAPLVTFGYAMTGHKAQGGEWDEVWVDFKYPGGRMNEAYYRWLYTVTTRARKCLYALAPPAIDDIAEAIERKLASVPQDDRPVRTSGAAVTLPQLLARHGCRMSGVERKPYQVSVTIASGDDAFAEKGLLVVSFKGSGVISYVRLAFVGATDALGADVAELKGRNIKTLLPEGEGSDQESATDETSNSHARLRDRLISAASKAGLRVLSIKSMTEHQLRLTLSSGLGDGFVDFYIDGKGCVSEMGSMTIAADSLRALRGGLS